MTTDRLGITILETNTCWELLRSCEVGRLAVAVGTQPDIFPINFVVDHGTVVFRTAEGTKLAAAVLGRGVAFEIDGYDADAGDAWSVVVKGRATEIERMQDVFDALDLPLFPWHASPKHRFVRSNQRTSAVGDSMSSTRASGVSPATSFGPRRSRGLLASGQGPLARAARPGEFVPSR